LIAVRSFDADLQMSEQPEVAAAIKEACHRQFPELLAIHKAHTENDKLGADYFLEFPNCKIETLDAKVRKLDYSLSAPGRTRDARTACIELVANTTNGKIGWSLDKDKITDWVLFHYIESGRSIFYNARELRAAVVANLPELKKTGKVSTQRTGKYESTSLFVSHRELWAAIYRHAHGNDNARLAA
jgi:hypothetical protein